MKALVVGGSNGVGLSIVLNLVKRQDFETIYVIDKNPFPDDYISDKIHYVYLDLSNSVNHEVLDNICDIDALYLTAGFGHLKLFQEIDCDYIEKSFAVNTIAPISIIRHYYDRLLSKKTFYCGVMVSIAGRLSSPLFSVYSATKAAVSKFIEATNIELEVQNSNNRILEISPGSLKGTSFTGGKTDPSLIADIADEIISRAERSEVLFIPQYDEVFKHVIQRYLSDPHKYGIESYWYKQKRMKQ